MLCSQLGINSTQSYSKQLTLLKQWFEEHISRDIQIEGTDEHQFERYKQLTEVYLADFLPETLQDIKKEYPKLGGENIIAASAFVGFDRVILSLKPDKALLNTPDANGMTPLHCSALGGLLNTTEVLLSLGADPGILNKQKQYPLFSALMVPAVDDDRLKQNKITIFRLLREKYSDHLNQQDEDGNTVLHQMAAHLFEPLIAETLQTHEELTYIKNNHHHYPIHTAILNDKIQNVALLLQVKDASLLADSNGWVALHYAARYSNNDILELCCEQSADVDTPDKTGKSPLMLAAESGRLSALKVLIGKGAQINLADLAGFTVLHHAVHGGNPTVVRWLLDNTAVDVNALDNQKHTPLYLSEREGRGEIKAILLEHGARTEPLNPRT